MRPSPTKPEAPAVPEKVTIVPKEVTPAIPKAEASMPEAVPEVVIPEFAYTGREVDEMRAELAGLKEWIGTEPARKLLNLIKTTGKLKAEVGDLTIKRFKELTGFEMVPTYMLTADKKHVRWEGALDYVAPQMGYETAQELKDAIENTYKAFNRIKSLEAELRGITPERVAPEIEEKPVEVEVAPEAKTKEQLTSVQKIRRFYQEKIRTYDQTKQALVDFAKGLPLQVRGRLLASYRCLDCHRLPGARRKPKICPFCGGKRLKWVGYTTRDMIRQGEYDHRLAKLPAAFKCLNRGWSVIPVIYADGRKRPPEGFKWKKYQERLPTAEEIRFWWGRKWPEAGIALVCGQVSGVYVLDIDPRNGGSCGIEGQALPKGPASRTMHNGQHCFFKSDIPLPKRQAIVRGVDFQGEGSYVVLPPSWGRYQWLEEPTGELPELPQWVADLVIDGTHHHPKRKQGKRGLSHPRPPIKDQVRFLPELNAACISRKLHWAAIIWAELRAFDQQRSGGSGFVPAGDGCNYLFDRGFSERRVFQALRDAEGLFLAFISRGLSHTIQLHSLKRVCETLGVEIKEIPHYLTPHWQYVPLEDFQGDKRLPYFRSVACYEAKDTGKRREKISRLSIRDRSGVSVRTQVRDADKLGLLRPSNKKNGRRKCGKSTYRPNKQQEGPRFYQEASIYWGAAYLGPVGRLVKVQKTMLGSRLKTGRDRDPSGSPTVIAALRPWKYFWTDLQYQRAAKKAQKGIFALKVDRNAEVEMAQAERKEYRVRHTVSLWREPKRDLATLVCV